MANHLESGGLAGKVHVSETTAKYLNGAYELEPADGHLRDGYIKQACVDTFFIKQTEPSTSQRRTGRRWPPTSTPQSSANSQASKSPVAATNLLTSVNSTSSSISQSAANEQRINKTAVAVIQANDNQMNGLTKSGPELTRCANERHKSAINGVSSMASGSFNEYEGSSLSLPTGRGGDSYNNYRLLFNKLNGTGCCGIGTGRATAGDRQLVATQKKAAKPTQRKRNQSIQRNSRQAKVHTNKSPNQGSSIEVEISRRMMKEHINWFRLTFKSPKLEEAYCQIRSTTSKSNIVYIFITWLLIALISLISTPDSWYIIQIILIATVPLTAFAFFYMSDSILYSKFIKYKLKEANQPANQQRRASMSNKRLSSQTSTSLALKEVLLETQQPNNEQTTNLVPAIARSLAKEEPSVATSALPEQANANRSATNSSETTNLLLNLSQKNGSISTSVSYASGQNHKVVPLVHRVAKFWSKLDRIPMIWNIFIFIFNLIMTVAILHMNFFKCKVSHLHEAKQFSAKSSEARQPTLEPEQEGLTCLHDDNLIFSIILIMIEMGSFFRFSYLRKVSLLTSMTICFMIFFYYINRHIQHQPARETLLPDQLAESRSFPMQTLTWSMFNLAYDHSACPLVTINLNASATNMSHLLAYPNLLPPYSLTTIAQCDPNLILKNCAILFILLIGLVYVCRSTERISRLDFLWKLQASKELSDMRALRHHNTQLLENILPDHVAAHFLKDERNSEELYAKSYDCVAVLFASIPNFSSFYSEDVNNGMECIRLLNEIIFDFDQLLEDDQFKSIEKVKTISSTYLAACGLDPRDQSLPPNYHLGVCCKFAFAMKRALNEVNIHSFNNFVMRIGISHGPLVGGVIGAKKPVFDIWGDTVNEASRMDSTGTMDMIQVPKRSADILEKEGFVVQYRGLIAVKGKGEMETCFVLSEKDLSPNWTKPVQATASPIAVKVEQAETRFINVRDNSNEINTNSAIRNEQSTDNEPKDPKIVAKPEPRTTPVVVKILEPKQDNDDKSSLLHRRFNRLMRNTQSLREPGGRSRYSNKQQNPTKHLQVGRCYDIELAGLQTSAKDVNKTDHRHLSLSWGHNRKPQTGNPLAAAHPEKESIGRVRSISPMDLIGRRQSGLADSIADELSKSKHAGPNSAEESGLAAFVFNMVQMRKDYEPSASLNSPSCNSNDLTNQAEKFITDTINDPPPGGLASGGRLTNKLSINFSKASTRKSARSRSSLFRKRSYYRRAGTSDVVDYNPKEESIHEIE